MANLSGASIEEYLANQPPVFVQKLFTSPASCLFLFNLLPQLSKHFVLRLLHIGTPISESVISSWVANPRDSVYRDALSKIDGLHLWVFSEHGVALDPRFQQGLGIAIMGGGAAWVDAVMKEDKYPMSSVALEHYAKERWEAVLNYMVGTTDTPSKQTREMVFHSEMKLQKGGTEDVTALGFQFLLQDQRTQLWFYLLQYLGLLEKRGLNTVECLSFLLKISLSTLTKCYPVETLTDTQRVVLKHCCEIGITYQRKKKSTRFYPTQHALLLSHQEQVDNSVDKRFLIIETNFRVYAYGDSELRISLLSRFAEIVYKMPNLTVTTITRESVRAALIQGITARQIIHFLQVHAHPQMRAQAEAEFPPLPPTISDQILLWEQERARIKPHPGVLYRNFPSIHHFQNLRDHARKINVLLSADDMKMAMVVTREGHPQVKAHWKQIKDMEGS